MEQDVEFGILQIVDIALKAISPAVNDPTTALTCIDQLGRILSARQCASRRPPRSATRGPPAGDPPPDFVPPPPRRRVQPDRPLRKADVAVPLRLMRVLGELAGATRHMPQRPRRSRDQARRLADACALRRTARRRTAPC